MLHHRLHSKPFPLFYKGEIMYSPNRFSARMRRLAACIAMGALLITAQGALAQEPPDDTPPAGYQFELSGIPDEAFPVTLRVTFEDGDVEVMAYQNGTVELDAQYGRIINIEGSTPVEGGNWYVNNPPGPTRPAGKHPLIPYPGLCLYFWYTWTYMPDYGNGWVQVMHQQWAPC